MRLNFDFDNVRATEFGIGRDSDDQRAFNLMSVDRDIQSALHEMAKDTWDGMQNMTSDPSEYEASEKHSGEEYLILPLGDELSTVLRELHQAENITLDMFALTEPKNVYCYFARLSDRQGRRLTALRRAGKFKGALKGRWMRLTTDALQLVGDKMFKLDSDFDMLIDSTNIHILRPSAFEFTSHLQEAILQAVPSNIVKVQKDLGFVDFVNIQTYSCDHPRAARLLASICSQKEMKSINKQLLRKTCKDIGVAVKVMSGKIVVPMDQIMDFLEILDRRRYQMELVKGKPEYYKATSRKKIDQ